MTAYEQTGIRLVQQERTWFAVRDDHAEIVVLGHAEQEKPGRWRVQCGRRVRYASRRRYALRRLARSGGSR